eukprot:TRINITY_DN6427_c0_g1_i4.p1 TRINITY_DN6427_c0_g1~~TRINITY_DN6427_c0_g1_i4.p1  ORF type:complete len:466 (+),score=89.07 TRINITY_DN6427_c0_g1_i4:93-1490(+)
MSINDAYFPPTSSKSDRMKRYVGFFAGCLMASISGTGYMFSSFAPELKETMGYSQTEINLVGTIMMVSGYASSIFIGTFYDKAGARITAATSAVFLFIGYFLLYLASRHLFWSDAVVVGLFLSLASLGSNGSYTVGLAGNIKNFPTKSRGVAVGVLAGFYGLSAAIFTKIYQNTFSPDEVQLFRFLSITLAAVCLGAGMFVFTIKTDDQEDTINVHAAEKAPLVPEGGAMHIHMHGKGLDLSPLSLVRNAEFWLLAVTFLCITGPGLTVIGNLGSLAIALGADSTTQNDLVIVLSVANFSGRMIFGVLSDIFARRVSRPFFLLVSLVVMCASQLVLAIFPSLSLVFLGVVLTGLAYGGSWAMVPTIISELWGESYFGTNFGLVGLSPALGSFVLGTLLSGAVYESHIPPGGGTLCHGPECYRLTWYILAGLSLAGLVTGYAFLRRTRSYYFGKSDKYTASYHLYP